MWNPWAEAEATEDLRRRLKWFLLGRLAVISCFLGVVAVPYLTAEADQQFLPLHDLLATIVVTYVFSLVSALVLPRTNRLSLYTRAQVAFDVVLVTAVVHLTGGTTSPFGFLYNLAVINSAALLFAGGAFLAATLAAVCYDGLVAATLAGLLAPANPLIAPEPFGLQASLRLVTMNVTFFLIAFLASILTRRLHAAESLLRERQAEVDFLAVAKEILARSIGSGLITTDRDGSITSVDQAAQDLIGRSQPELVGSDVGAALPPLKLTPTARLRLLQSGGEVEPFEFAHEPAGGEARHLRCTAAALKDTFGNPIGALYVLQNITAIKELDRQPVSASDLDAITTEKLDAALESTEARDGLYGVSPEICEIRDTIQRVAASDATVLIGGESGTGKEVVARAIHVNSHRRHKPFVAINCGAIPEHLIESELFGHVKGAFTGAVADRPGCFRTADGGSLFLDEIGDLPLHLQVKLLRVLQERTFRPVGSEKTVAVDVRIIAASNRDIRARVEEGQFREDLFYRLNVIALEVPPLRARREDIPLLVRHFLRQFSKLHQRPVKRFSEGAARLLLQYGYPGNVRELENIVEHAVAMCIDETVTEEHLPRYLVDADRLQSEHGPPAGPRSESGAAEARPLPALFEGSMDLDRDLEEYEKAIILRALEQAGGVKKRAAEILGINYRSLRHRLQKYGLAGGDSAP